MVEAGERIAMPESEFYANIIRTALDGFWLADTEGRLLDVNDAYCKMTGYSREELLQMSVRDLEAAENAEETAAHIKKTIEQGSDRFESRHRRKDGATIEIEIGVTYSPAGGGQFIAFLRDITQRKTLEKNLERKVEERTKELSKKVRELEMFNNVAIDRELKMAELKKRIVELEGGAK